MPLLEIVPRSNEQPAEGEGPRPAERDSPVADEAGAAYASEAAGHADQLPRQEGAHMVYRCMARSAWALNGDSMSCLLVCKSGLYHVQDVQDFL